MFVSLEISCSLVNKTCRKPKSTVPNEQIWLTVRNWVFSSSCHWLLTVPNPERTCFISALLPSTCVTLHEIPSPSEPHFCLWRNRGFDFIISKVTSMSDILGFWNYRDPRTPLLSPDPLWSDGRGRRKGTLVAAAWWKRPWDLWNSDNFGNHTEAFVSY